MYCGAIFLDDVGMFCTPRSGPGQYGPFDVVVRAFERLHYLGATPIVFFAHDFFAHPRWRDLVRLAGALRQEFGVATSGTMATEQRLWPGIANPYVRYVRLWTDGVLTDSVRKTLREIDRYVPGVLVDIMVPFSAARPLAAEDIKGLVTPPFSTNWSFRVFPAPDSTNLDADIRAVQQVVANTRDLGNERVRLVWEGFPLCLMREYRDARYGIERYELMCLDSDLSKRDLHYVQGFTCWECTARKDCLGVPNCYGDEATCIMPERGYVSSGLSFVRVREGIKGRPVPDNRCALYFKNRDLDYKRTFYLAREDGTLDMFSTESLDFSSDHILRIKNDYEQIFIDLAPPLLLRAMEGQSPDRLHFSHHAAEHKDGKCCRFCYEFRYQTLKMAEECRTCQTKATCFGVFRPIEENMFLREKQMWDEKVMRHLRGRVLDVGCGKQPYRRSLNELLGKGLIEYVAVEPDREALAGLQADLIAGTFLAERFEDVEFADSSFDHCLVIRSFNHLDDPVAAFTKIARILKVGGRLTLIDAVPLAIAGTPEQVQALAELKSPSDFEHRRNYDCAEVMAFLGRFPFRLEVAEPVGPKTSFIWHLSYTRV